MGKTLLLAVPEEKQTVETLRQYYSFVLEKKKRVAPDREWPDVEENSDYRFAKHELERGGEFYVLSQVTSDIIDDLGRVGDRDHDKLVQFFREHGDEEMVIYGETITELRDLFKELKQLEDPNDPTFRDLRIETQYIALCEFAEKRGYGVGFSY